MTDPESWTVTTHDWAHLVDETHLASIRLRPETYGAGGVRHLVLEVLAYANDEAAATGRTGHVAVSIAAGHEIRVVDDGRGTDTRLDARGRPVRKPVMATRDVRFFDAADPPILPDGLPRRGMSVVAALSSTLVHENRRIDGSWSQAYRHGVPDSGLAVLSPPPSFTSHGTTVTFVPDPVVPGPWLLAASDLTAFNRLEISSSYRD